MRFVKNEQLLPSIIKPKTKRMNNRLNLALFQMINHLFMEFYGMAIKNELFSRLWLLEPSVHVTIINCWFQASFYFSPAPHISLSFLIQKKKQMFFRSSLFIMSLLWWFSIYTLCPNSNSIRNYFTAFNPIETKEHPLRTHHSEQVLHCKMN